MDFLEKNLQFNNKLKNIYSSYKDSLYEVEKSKTGDYTLMINNLYFHSKYDPLKEANRIVDMLLIDRELIDVIILFGNGLGYVARLLFEKLLKNKDQSILPYIIYIEKDLKLFLTTLKYFDWSELFMNENFKFFLESEKEIIGNFIQFIPTKRIRYFYHRPSYILHESYYKDTQNYISYVLDRKDMNTATFCNFQKLWTKNLIYNLPRCLYSKPIKYIKNIAKDNIAVVVAAGPNLNKCIDYLKKVKDSAIIIAVDTVYKYLKKNLITPDIIVTIDPQYWNYKFLENEKIKDPIIVTDANVYPKIFQLSEINNYFTGSSIFPITKYFDENNSQRGSICAGGSVATTAFDTARIIGSNTIVLIGLDLSFPDRLTHFKGAFFEINFLNTGNYFNTPEQASYKYLSHADLKVIESTNGKVYTDQKMFLFKKWFDREIPLTSVPVLLPDLGGSILEGAKILKLEDLPVPGHDKKLFNKLKTEICKKEFKVDWDNVEKKIKLIIANSGNIKTICKSIVDKIPEDGTVAMESEAEITKLESSLFENSEREKAVNVISSSAQDILLSIMENKEFSEDIKASAWIKTRILYESIYQLSDFYKKALQKVLKIK